MNDYDLQRLIGLAGKAVVCLEEMAVELSKLNDTLEFVAMKTEDIADEAETMVKIAHDQR